MAAAANALKPAQSSMRRTISDAVRALCLSFPEAEEVRSHGMPDFRVNGKTFATYAINHHGDGRIALWLNALPGAQAFYVENEPEHYFVPPYVGPRGWLGVQLDRGLSWNAIAKRVREAYEKIAPPKLARLADAAPEVEPPNAPLPLEAFDPLARPRAQEVLAGLRKICLALPETAEATQFGNPVFRAGKKTFACAHSRRGRIGLQFWVGPDRQVALTLDKRYRIPPYIGHNGWIELDAEDHADWQEIKTLALESYRHFALKRMLKALAEDG